MQAAARDAALDAAAMPSDGIDTVQVIDVTELFDAHAAFLLRQVERLSGPGPHVEDIVQETFVVAHRRRADLAQIEQSRAWLYRVAANITRHHHRGAGRRARLAEHYFGQARQCVEQPDEAAERRGRALLVRACVAELSDKPREALILYEFEGLTSREIALLLRIPAKTVESRLRLARRSFERRFSERAAQMGMTL